jgi:LuxR family maltose regulon positive regulatory protein
MPIRGRSPDLAKFSRPRLARVHPRERLFRRLDECLECHPAVWVSGVPGAGKTTLIASYLNARKLRALWYRVDSGDSDAAACCHYLQAAATRIAPQAGSELPLPGSAPIDDPGRFLRRFFAALYARLGSPHILVLDNTQEALAAAGFRQLLWAAISEVPDHSGLIIASRTHPPGDFARLLANGDLVVLGADELWFAEDESLAVQQLSASPARTRSAVQMRELHQATGGWAAGLQLLLHHADPDSTAAVSGHVASDTALCDYLAAEVFDRQPEAIRSFLLKVAHLPRMTPATASALGGSAGAARILASMQRDNVFTAVHEVDGELHYEFHPLLRQFLLWRARVDLPAAERARVMRLAASLLAQAGEVDAAAQVLIAGGQWDDLQRLIVEHAARLLERGWHQTLAAWLDALPEDRLENDPWFGYWRGATLLPRDTPAALVRLHSAYRRFRERRISDGSFLAWSAIVDQICLEGADFSRLDRWLDEAESLRSAFGEPADPLTGRFTASLFAALFCRRPQDPAIHPLAERLLALIEASSDDSQRIVFGYPLQLHYAVGVGLTVELDRLMQAVEPPPGTALTPLAEILLCALRAIHLWSRGRSFEAAAAAENGKRLARENGVCGWDGRLGALQACAWLNSGDISRARAVLQQMAKCLEPQHKLDLAHHHYLAGLASLLADEGAQALSQIETANALARRYGGPQQHALASLTQAQALHAVHRRAEAWACLEQGRRMGVSLRSRLLRFQADLCAASFALDEGDDERCASALHSAFALGAQQDYLSHPTFRPAPMARLCAFALARGIFPAYARRLIRQRGFKPPGLEVEYWPWPVKIHTLGRFSLTVDGETVAEAGGHLQRKPVELLQTLITLGGRRIALPILIAALWPDAESKGGRGAFESSLSRLRRLLGHDEALLIEGGRLTLNPELCWVDLWSFERLLGRLEAALHAPGETDVAGLLAQTDPILRLYQGDFLDREGGRPGARALQQRLRARLVHMLADVGGRLEAAGDWDQAARVYRRAIDLEPLAEKEYRRLMSCLLQQGETAEAVHVYFRCCEALWAGLQTVPSRETEALRRSLEGLPGPDHPPRA